jgi:CTP:molybdopterin cytidylyltransferase MocA
VSRPTVAAVVLAAGGGRRYGMPKALVEYEGSLLVERAVRTARAVCDPVLVVLGAQAAEVWRRADLDGAIVLANADWASGMASSLRTGLDGLRGWPVAAGRRGGGLIDAALVLLVDMPGMTPAALERMARHAAPDALAVATYDGERGHPVLIGRAHWAGVAESLSGDEGARRYLAAHGAAEVDCTGLADPVDLDVPRTDRERGGQRPPRR